MFKTIKFSTIALALVFSFTIMAQDLYAQEGPTRVAVLIEFDESFNDADELVDQILNSARELVNETDGFQAISGRQLVDAQRELELNISADSSSRDIRQFANEVDADVVVVFTVNNLPNNQIRISTDAFGSRGGELFDARSDRVPENADGAISRFVTNTIEAILELL